MASPVASYPPPPPSSQRKTSAELEITVISAKHLKNVNWRNGDLKPYAVAYLDPDHRFATKPDDSGGSTSPVWNERLTLPIPSSSPSPLFLTLDIFHSKPSETPKPLVATARIPLSDLIFDLNHPPPSSAAAAVVKILELRRPSGRPQGKLRIKIALGEPASSRLLLNQTYQFSNFPPQPPSPAAYYYHPSPRDYHRTFSPPPQPLLLPRYANLDPAAMTHSPYPYSSHASEYYTSNTNAAVAAAPGYFSAVAPPTRPLHYDYRPVSCYAGPSAPIDYGYSSSSSSSSAPYYSYEEHLQQKQKRNVGTGMAVGAVAGALGGLALGEGLKYEEDKAAEQIVENDLASRDNYSDNHADYN